jgi:hypothetical protein
MWRKLSAALIGAALIATPVLAVETVTAPATVPAKIHSVPKINMPQKIGAVVARSRATAAKKLAGTKVTKGKLSAMPRPTELAKANGTTAKAAGKRRQVAAAKTKNTNKQRLSALPPKSKNIKAAEPVETTGSVAPRSVPAPGLY